MKIKIVVITDVHFSTTPNIAVPSRRKEFGDILLNRAVNRINRFIKPDITLLLGDLVDDAQKRDLEVIKSLSDKLQCPKLVVPGNHDGDFSQFFDVFQELPDYLDVAGYRFVPFCDEEAPGYNATRSESDLARMRRVREGYDGPIIAIQHVPLFQPGTHSCPYNLTNAETAWQIMKEEKIEWVIAGHYHDGFQLSAEGFASITAPALCSKPFRFWEINIDGKNTSFTTRCTPGSKQNTSFPARCTPDGKQNTEVIEHRLSMPAELRLTDCHIHSRFAYCNENMDFGTALELADLFDVPNVVFSEHSVYLYFDRDGYQVYLRDGFEKTRELLSAQIDKYLDEAKSAACPAGVNVLLGLEVDADLDGKPVILDEDREKFDILLGAMHRLPPDVVKDVDTAAEAFRTILTKFIGCGFQILAHPFRIFRRSRLPTPEHLFPFVVRLLKEHNVAAELNFHTNEPPLEFVQMCLAEGVKFAFGSDAHNLYEVGELYPNLLLLEEAGYTGNPEDILYPFPC